MAAWLGVCPILAGDSRISLPVGGVGAGEGRDEPGQYGGDLALLRSLHTALGVEDEGNHFFDLWDPGSVAAFAAVHGLTNNRALFIDSHGIERFAWRGRQYVFRPHRRIVRPGKEVPTYSIRDVASVMGSQAAAAIHNIVIAGCNEGGVLKAAEFRRYFVNATNVTYMAAGRLAYKPVFFQVLTHHSLDIEPLYGRPVSDARGVEAVEISRRPGLGAERLGDYVADLFAPGATKPFRRQRAGRELLEPGFGRSGRAQTEADAADQTSFL